ncbi:hypothetical protein [Endozoicomonas acroporae]|uniref:hypothetical protein n=1 Tax=Endozoicomonas acroporae TaxID=1701104 RepID=UPI003D7A4871
MVSQLRWNQTVIYKNRYLASADVSWRHDDIARLHTLRWLIEVFFEDWKLHEGGCNRALQQGIEGSERGVILSVLCDHMLLLHPEQSARLEHKQPRAGSLRLPLAVWSRSSESMRCWISSGQLWSQKILRSSSRS